MYKIEYFDETEWIAVGALPFATETLAWASLGDDTENYRVVPVKPPSPSLQGAGTSSPPLSRIGEDRTA